MPERNDKSFSRWALLRHIKVSTEDYPADFRRRGPLRTTQGAYKNYIAGKQLLDECVELELLQPLSITIEGIKVNYYELTDQGLIVYEAGKRMYEIVEPEKVEKLRQSPKI